MDITNRDFLTDHLNRIDFDPRFKSDDVIYWFDGTKYSFLSNFHMHPIKYNGKVYASTEHAFQAAKTFDENWEEAIRITKTPGEAKRKGGLCPMRPDWDEIKNSVMAEVLELKFQDPDLQDALLNTYPKYLVEGTLWHDNWWGICLLKNCKKCEDKKALNMLGILLMELREKILARRLQEEVDLVRGIKGN